MVAAAILSDFYSAYYPKYNVVRILIHHLNYGIFRAHKITINKISKFVFVDTTLFSWTIIFGIECFPLSLTIFTTL